MINSCKTNYGRNCAYYDGTKEQQYQSLLTRQKQRTGVSLSEIVVPLIHNEQVVAVLDVDSENLTYFDDTDRYYLEMILSMIVIRQ